MNTLTSLLDAPIIDSLARALAHSLWQGAAAALLLALALRLIPSRRSSLRYWTACATLAALVVAFSITLTSMLRRDADLNARPTSPHALSRPAPSPQTPAPLDAAPAMDPQPSPFQPQYIVAAWLLGVAFFSTRHACGWAWLVHLRRGQPSLDSFDATLARLRNQLHIRRPIQLLESARVDGPWVIGLFKPVILVPLGLLNELSPQQVEAILLHELAHIRRHDYLVNILQAVIETVFFYHPAVWWISSQIRLEREHCCDDIAAASCPSPAFYVESLLAVEQRRVVQPHLALAAAGPTLSSRVRRLLNIPNIRRVPRIRSLAAAALALSCLILPLALSQSLRAADPSPVPTTTSITINTDTITFDAAKQNISPIKPEDLDAPNEDYKIGANDLLRVSVMDLAGPGVETVKDCRVSEKGSISVPVAGQLKVAGLTEAEIEKAIIKLYNDKNLIAHAQVSAHVAEAHGRTFSILGQIDRPGQYQITQSDFRILDALALCAAKTDEMSELYVIRGKDKDARVIPIPLKQLIAGDLSVNIVIRPGDILMSPKRERKFVRVTVTGQDQISINGKPLTWTELDKQLTDIPASERKHTVLELAVAAPDMPVSQYFDVESKLIRRVKDYGMDYFSNVGIDRSPATNPAAATNPGASADLTIEQIAKIDPTMAAYLNKRDEIKYELETLVLSLGKNHRTVQSLSRALETQNARIKEYATAFRQAH